MRGGCHDNKNVCNEMIAGFITKRFRIDDTVGGSGEHLVTSQTFIIIEDFLSRKLVDANKNKYTYLSFGIGTT